MHSHARLDGLQINATADQAEQTNNDVLLNSPSRGKQGSTQTRLLLHYTDQADATHFYGAVSRPLRRTHRFKQHSISTGTLSKHTNKTVHFVDARPPPVPPKRNISITRSSTSAIHSARMIDPDRPRMKKERNFIGGSCAACELPLEHKLSGEKVLQFSCGHVAHEACLYEYIKDDDEPICPTCDAPLSLDTTRVGNGVLDLNRLSSKVRSIAQAPAEMGPTQPSKKRDSSTPQNDDAGTSLRLSQDSSRSSLDIKRECAIPTMNAVNFPPPPTTKEPAPRPTSHPVEATSPDIRKHDSEFLGTESQVENMDYAKDIPRPKVTIRSEFPTLTRSIQQQSLTCLVTVEVPPKRTYDGLHNHMHPFSAPVLSSETPRALQAIAADLKERVDDWHGLEADKFGPLRLHANLKVGRDGTNWQKLDCYLFSELLICVREKRATQPIQPGSKPRCQLKGSILIKRHLRDVEPSPESLILTLNLTVGTLPTFRLKFSSREQLDVWRLALLPVEDIAPTLFGSQEEDTSGTDDEEGRGRPSSTGSSNHSGAYTATTAGTDYADGTTADQQISTPLHVPIDVVVVIPISSSMQGLKIKLLKDALRFIITHLGERDRMGLVSFGSNGGAVSLVGLATKDWYGWRDVYRSIKPIGQRSLRADPVEGANAALELLSQRKGANPLSSVLLISDSSNSEVDSENINDVVQRAHKAKVGIYSFGLGQTHKPDNLIELSSRTNASYVYVKDWMMLRECVAGCLGSLQSTSHMSAKLKLKIPDGSMAKFVKVSGALHASKRIGGREAEAILGDLRLGDKREVLVQLSVDPDLAASDDAPHDHWETIVNGLATLGGSLEDGEFRPQSVEEVPLIGADLSYGDFAKKGAVAHLSHPSLLTITMLPRPVKSKRTSRGSIMPPIPSHPSIVQRRMEMLTSDMLTRALTLVSKGQNDGANRLLTETRTILQGLGKGSLPPLPPATVGTPGHSRASSMSRAVRASHRLSTSSKDIRSSSRPTPPMSGRSSPMPSEDDGHSSSSSLPPAITAALPRAATSLDQKIIRALDADIESCLEFISHPAVFAHDARKAALQTIGVISSQRGYTFRTETEAFWASKITGVKRMGEITKDWQMVGNDTLTEEV